MYVASISVTSRVFIVSGPSIHGTYTCMYVACISVTSRVFIVSGPSIHGTYTCMYVASISVTVVVCLLFQARVSIVHIFNNNNNGYF